MKSTSQNNEMVQEKNIRNSGVPEEQEGECNKEPIVKEITDKNFPENTRIHIQEA